MRLTAWEEERLLIFSAAELARRRLARGIALNHPEAVAVICDAMLEAARDGASYEAIEAVGRETLVADQVMAGVAELLDEIRLEVLMGDGVRLIVIVDPLGAAGQVGPDAAGRGARQDRGAVGWAPPERERRELAVTSTSQRVIRVSSHYPFHRVNRRLEFDRDGAVGFRLDVAAGDSVRWGPGETKRVRLVRYERGADDSGASS